MTEFEGAGADPALIEPAALRPSDVLFSTHSLPGALTPEQRSAVTAYIQHIVARRIRTPVQATREATDLIARFNDLYQWAVQKRSRGSAFEFAIHRL